MKIDTIAEAIFSKDAKPGTAAHWRAVDSQTRTHYRKLAQAAIDAMQLTEQWTVEGGADAAEDGWICAEIAATREEAESWPVSRESDARVVSHLVSPWVEVSS